MLRKFFDYYFERVDQDVLQLYQQLMPDCKDLAESYAAIFTRNDEESINFLLDFYRATADLRHKKSAAVDPIQYA